ncbi:hypothetical protein ACU4GD_18840 [Cupriavidus basilensis]
MTAPMRWPRSRLCNARALLIEDAWLCNEFGTIWRDLGAPDRALPLFEQSHPG